MQHGYFKGQPAPPCPANPPLPLTELDLPKKGGKGGKQI